MAKPGGVQRLRVTATILLLNFAEGVLYLCYVTGVAILAAGNWAVLGLLEQAGVPAWEVRVWQTLVLALEFIFGLLFAALRIASTFIETRERYREERKRYRDERVRVR